MDLFAFADDNRSVNSEYVSSFMYAMESDEFAQKKNSQPVERNGFCSILFEGEDIVSIDGIASL